MMKTYIDFLPTFVLKAIKKQKINVKVLNMKEHIVYSSEVFTGDGKYYCYNGETTGIEIRVSQKTNEISEIIRYGKILYEK